MRGTPSKIQTRQDLQNLFALWQQGYEGIDKDQFIGMINSLCAQQYFNVPIIEADGTKVTTRYFYEAEVGGEVDGGITITAVEHFTPDEDILDGEEADETPTRTLITLSAALPAESKFLKAFNSCNCIDQRGFDRAEIDYILGVLQSE